MKKLTLLLVILLACGLTMGFADEDQLEFELGGSASTTFGINLDENAAGNTASGLQNETSFELDITLVSEQSAEKGEGDVYGWIMLEDFEVTINESDLLQVSGGDVSAEVRIGPVYIDIDGSEAIEVDHASLGGLTGDATIVDLDVQDAYDVDLTSITYFTSGSVLYPQDLEYVKSGILKVGFIKEDVIDAWLKIGSYNDWFEDPASTPDWEHAYALGVGTEVTVADATIAFDAIMGMNYAELEMPIAVGVDVEYELALSDTFSVVPFAGLDFINRMDDPSTGAVEDDQSAIEVGGGAKILWPGAEDADSKFAQDETDENIESSGASVAVNYVMIGEADPYLNLILAAYEDAGDESLVPGLGVEVYFEWYDILDVTNVTYFPDDAMGFGVYAEYTVADITPYGQLTYDMSDDDVTLKLGVDLALIPNTTFTLEYYNPRVMEHGDAVAVPVADAYLGNITFTTEIEY